MKRYPPLACSEQNQLAFALTGIALLATVYAAPVWSRVPTAKTAHDVSITFSRDLSATVAEARKSGKPVALVFFAVWCPNCRKLEAKTLPTPEVQAMGDDFLWARIDIDRHASIARSYDVNAVPEVLLLDPMGVVRMRIIGAAAAELFHSYLTEFLDNIQLPPGPGPAIRGTGSTQTRLTWRPRGYREKSGCFSNVGYGPLRIRSQSPFQTLRLAMVPRTPSTLTRGEKEVRAAATWANIWSPDSDHSLDFETLQLGASFAYGITDTWQVEVGLESASRFGGELDSLIQEFHDLTNVDQNGRDEVPKGDFKFELSAPNGSRIALDDGDRGEFARGLVVTVQNNVTCGTDKLPAFAYAITWRYELESDDLEGGSRSDFGISLAASRRFGKVYAYVTLGFASFGRDSFRGIPLNDTQTSFLGAVEWRHWPKTSLIAQFLVTEGAAEDLGDFSKPSNEIVFGWKKELGSGGTVLEAGVVENVITPDNSPDFGLHFGISHRF
ncbi:MAG: DUF3187 family protein [Acidiferrobacterales bacterium]